MPEVNVMHFPTKGMITDIDPNRLPEDAYVLGVNVRLDKGRLLQISGRREVPLESEEEGLVEDFQNLNWQGGIEYTPSQGQSAIQFASKGSFLLCAAGGRKFTIEIVGKGGSLRGLLNEVTGSYQHPPDQHQIWLAQAENFAIASDDFSSTWIWDFVTPGRESLGFNLEDRENSEVPNFSRLPSYTQGRLAVTIDSNGLLIGDIIHGSNLTQATDLIRFTEQTYAAEGQRFVMPSESGAILATYTLPIIGDVNNQGDYIIECEHKSFSLKTYVFPRTSWGDGSIRMVESVSSDGGARGQFAYDVYNNGALRRTLRGLETLSFSALGDDLPDNPQRRFSYSIDDYLNLDYGPLLRFCSVKFRRRENKVYSTIRPFVNGLLWAHRGIISYNYDVQVWESVITMPPEYSDIIQLVNMDLDGEQRMFCSVSGNDGKLRIIEFDEGLDADILPDGSEERIESQVMTRFITQDFDSFMEIDNGVLNFDDVLGVVDYEVLFRTEESQGTWYEWARGTICHDEFSHSAIRRQVLGRFPGIEQDGIEVRQSRAYQFLIKWKGKASPRFLRVDLTTSSSKGDNDPNPDPEDCNCTKDIKLHQFDEFEYSY